MKKTLSVLATAALGVSMLAVPAFAAHENTTYSGTLNSLNGETGSGTASIAVDGSGDNMTVTVNASDLELDFVHAMHIHAVYSGDLSAEPGESDIPASACPTVAGNDTVNGGDDPSADDADQSEPDGFVNVLEGASSYGGVQVSLTTEGDTSGTSALAVDRFPTGTEIDYEREIPIPNALKDELADVHIVVHGTDIDGNGSESNDDGEVSSLDPNLPFDATAPALCGTLTVASTGSVDTGAGGTATDNNGALALGLGGLALAGAVALRRRGLSS